MGEQLGDVSQFVRFEAVDCRVLFGKDIHEGLSPPIIQQTEACRD
jgi:hypothetical protein